MKQKKISSIVLAAALVLSLAACQSKESGDSSQRSEEHTSELQSP